MCSEHVASSVRHRINLCDQASFRFVGYSVRPNLKIDVYGEHPETESDDRSRFRIMHILQNSKLHLQSLITELSYSILFVLGLIILDPTST